MVTDAASARERVRLILDRANSPWLTDSEINGFIEMSINEYLRERLNGFGANQKIRDDFGKFVKSVVYSNEPIGDDEDSDNTDFAEDVFRRQLVNYDTESVFDQETIMATQVVGGEWGYATGATPQAVGCLVTDTESIEGSELANIFFGYLLDVKVMTSGGGLSPCKIRGLDELLLIQRDPFNRSEPGIYECFRINDIYWVKPAPAVTTGARVILTYVSNDNSVDSIEQLPNHGREEVCQIAARKIMGTVADERMPAADNEIKQLEGK